MMCCCVDISDVHVVVIGCFFFQAEDGIRDLVRSRGLGDVYKRQDEAVRRCAQTPGATVVDVGTGSGCLAVSVALALPLSLIHI